MLMNRIMGVFTFKKEVYADVEKDTTFTTTAWGIVAVVGLVNGLVGYLSGSYGIVGLVLSAVLGVAGFAVGALVVAWVAKALFKSAVTFEAMVRTLGLAYVWGIVGILAVVPFLGVITCLTSLLSLASFFIAAKEAVDLDWAQTIVSVVIGYIAILAVVAVVGGFIGLGAGVAGALLNR